MSSHAKASQIFDEFGYADISPQIGVNYTDDSLERSMTKDAADLLISKILSSYEGQNISLIILGSGIGTIAMSAMMSDKIDHVICYHENPSYSMIMNNNFTALRFDEEKYTISDDVFTSVDKSVGKFAIIVDFSWSNDGTIYGRDAKGWMKYASENSIKSIFFRYKRSNVLEKETKGFYCSVDELGVDMGYLASCRKGRQESDAKDISGMWNKIRRNFEVAKVPADKLDEFFEGDCVEIWKHAMQDSTIDIRNNSDIYAKIGKNSWALAVSTHINEKYPDHSSKQVLDAIDYYTSTHYAISQSKFNGLPLNEYFKSKLRITQHTLSILFYALIGGMYQCSNKVLGKGFGQIVIQNFATYLMNATERKVKSLMAKSTDRRKIDEFMRDMYADMPSVAVASHDGVYSCVFTASDPDNMVSGYGINGIIGWVEGGTSRDVVIRECARKSVDLINSKTSMSDAKQAVRTVHRSFVQVEKKAIREGMNPIYLTHVKTDASRYFVRLVSNKVGDDNVHILSEGIGYSRKEAESIAIENYLKS